MAIIRIFRNYFELHQKYLFPLILMSVIFLSFPGTPAFSQLLPGDILVVDDGVGTDDRGVIFRIDPVTGQRNILTDFGNIAQGPLGEDPSDLALSDSGLIFVIDSDGGTNAIGALYTVDPSTGNRVLISDFGNIADGPLGSLPRGVTVTNSGDVLVTDRDAGTDGYGALFKVDPVTGVRVMVSDFGNNAQGPLGRAMDIKEDNSGNIFVVVR
ncbi:MAG: hypothetical protein JRJ60_11205, partial [Deltaproteobacteria bacterium]|nr:hypothetical protein [Deltaproteobacteria bacterium]